MKFWISAMSFMLLGLTMVHFANKGIEADSQRCRAVNGVYVQGANGLVCIEARQLPLESYL